VADWDADQLAVLDPATGRELRRIPAKQTWGGVFSPDGRQLAFIEQDDIVIWDWAAGQPLRRLRGHLSTVVDVAYSPDGQRLASCSRDRRIHLWEAKTGTLLRTMMSHRSHPVQVAFLGHDRLVSREEEGTVVVWHANFGLRLCSLRDDRANPCFHLAVSPDQRWLACRLGVGDIQLFDVSMPAPASNSASSAETTRTPGGGASSKR
jgi:WD40 repeat protein